jgi:hypothetical protein
MARRCPPGGWPKKPFKVPPGLRLPNEGSNLQTPTTLLIDLHYAQHHIWERWTWERFKRFCAFLNVTPAELASIACIPHNQLELFEQRNRIMQGHAPNRAAALLLTLHELNCCAAYTKDVVANPFPNLAEGVRK